MNINLKSLFVFLFIPLIGCTTVDNTQKPNTIKTETEQTQSTYSAIVSKLSGATYITEDLQKSVDFYETHLGFSEGRRRTLDDESARAIFGVQTGETILYTTMLPTNFSKERRDFTTVNFAEIKTTQASSFINSISRRAMYGEPVMAFDVTNLRTIHDQMKAAGNITIIDPLQVSPTGRSLTLTVFDPNGVRIQLYEFLAGKR